jgi:hypothetical protein
VWVFDTYNALVQTTQGIVTYNQTAGNFQGTVDMGTLSSGLYTVKLKSDRYLQALVPGIQTITAGQAYQLPAVTLIVGDINGDNQINIIDYNILMGCYSDLLPPSNCPSQYASLADLNDDGAVNQFDYNLFLRQLTNKSGQ